MHCGQTPVEVPSPELEAAQERLIQLRKVLLAERDDSHSQHRTATHNLPPNHLLQAQAELYERRKIHGVEVNHGSPHRSSSNWIDRLAEQYSQLYASPPADTGQISFPNDETVPVYPSILTAMLKERLEAAGRIYLLLYHLDSQGRGWLTVDHAREKLTHKSSPLRVCGWRRLRQLLQQGQDIFWQRDDQDRLWLRGPHRIAQKLGCGRLHGSRIDLPLKTLLGGIQAVRAHFYAAFHSGRRRSAPVGRAHLKNITGLPERTQRAYDHISGTERRYNMAVGPRYSKKTAEEQAWLRGRGMFRFIDSQGRQGAPNGEYVAWHMPNSYQGPHGTRCKGRQKRINRRLSGLVQKGTRGNISGQVEKLFWPDGAAAGRAYNRDGENDAYWPQARAEQEQRVLWYVLEGG